MPGFKGHLTFGLITGAALSITAVSVSDVKHSLVLPIILSTTAGAVIADFDSESSVPFHVASSIFSILTGIIVFFYFKKKVSGIEELLIWAVGPAATAKFILCPVIKKTLTTHRGMWHSIPAAVIASLAAFLLLQRVSIEMNERFYIALSLGAGYISHLVLDEGKSLVHFKFLIFWSPKKSAGSALKLFGHSKITTLFVYTVLLYLAWCSYPFLMKCHIVLL
ncbi:MAG: metal-dependent hydrolase [Nitrospirae bacterium YQR-1]